MIDTQMAENFTDLSTGPPLSVRLRDIRASKAVAAGISTPTKANAARDNEILQFLSSKSDNLQQSQKPDLQKRYRPVIGGFAIIGDNGTAIPNYPLVKVLVYEKLKRFHCV